MKGSPALVRQQRAHEGKNINTRKFVVPLPDARVSSLWYLESRVQILLLDIRSSINLLNEIVTSLGITTALRSGNSPTATTNWWWRT
jgi:hypothetical protein